MSSVEPGSEEPSDEEATAAGDGDVRAPGSPGELSSDQTPSQGEERGETVPAEGLGDVAGGDAGAPESGGGSQATEEEGSSSPPAEGGAESAAAPDQPPPTPSAAVAEGAAVQKATEDKVAQAVAAREAATAATAEAEAEPAEIDEARQTLVDTLGRILGDGMVGSHVVPGVDAWVRVAVSDWRRAAEVCRDQLGLTYFCYLSAIDWLPSPYGRSEESPQDDDADGGEATTTTKAVAIEQGFAGGETRFQLLARLVSPTSHLGVTLKADLDDDLVAPSLIEVFAGADWHERETWEMYGISFTGHPNLAHLYLPGGFEGHPLRKDFPLLAREVKPWPGLVDVEAMPGESDGA